MNAVQPRRRRALLAITVVASSALAAVMVVTACTPDTPLLGTGQECFAASDCEPGLVCVAQKSGTRICTSDLTGVEGRPPAMAESDANAEGGDASTDASTDAPAVPDAPVVPDTGVIDTGLVDAAEAG